MYTSQAHHHKAERSSCAQNTHMPHKETPVSEQQVIIAQEEIIVSMVHADQEEPWDSDASMASSTSTPDFKHGKHQNDLLAQQARSEILETVTTGSEGDHSVHRPPSMHILSDARLSNWPSRDNICMMDYHPGWGFQHWISALRAETIWVKCNTVVLYFEKSQDYEDVPPVKNSLHTICKVLHQHNQTVCIFIANILPKASASPVRRVLAETKNNFVLLQAVHSVNRALGKVHYLSIYEHFTSQSGSVIRPVHKYFKQDNVQLSSYGCLIFRECVMREAGIKSYWFK